MSTDNIKFDLLVVMIVFVHEAIRIIKLTLTQNCYESPLFVYSRILTLLLQAY